MSRSTKCGLAVALALLLLLLVAVALGGAGWVVPVTAVESEN